MIGDEVGVLGVRGVLDQCGAESPVKISRAPQLHNAVDDPRAYRLCRPALLRSSCVVVDLAYNLGDLLLCFHSLSTYSLCRQQLSRAAAREICVVVGSLAVTRHRAVFPQSVRMGTAR